MLSITKDEFDRVIVKVQKKIHKNRFYSLFMQQAYNEQSKSSQQASINQFYLNSVGNRSCQPEKLLLKNSESSEDNKILEIASRKKSVNTF